MAQEKLQGDSTLQDYREYFIGEYLLTVRHSGTIKKKVTDVRFNREHTNNHYEIHLGDESIAISPFQMAELFLHNTCYDLHGYFCAKCGRLDNEQPQEESVTQETSPSPTEEEALPAVEEGEYPRANVEYLHLRDKWLRMEKPHSMKEFRIKDVRYIQELPEGRAKCYRICLDKCIKNVEVTPSEMRGLMIFGTCETDDGQRFTIVKETSENTQETSPTATPSEEVVGAENAQTTSGYLGKVVRVEWQDHYTLRGWWPMKDLDTEPVRCVSIGRVIIETDQILMVAGTIGQESENHEEKASDPIAIIKGEIISITEIQGVAL